MISCGRDGLSMETAEQHTLVLQLFKRQQNLSLWVVIMINVVALNKPKNHSPNTGTA